MLLQPFCTVIPTLSHDYAEWHRGREDYALWYIEITEPKLQHYLQKLREHFSPFLFQPNIRQFHITLFICGFLTEYQPVLNDDFSQQQLSQQIKNLTKQKLGAFKIKTGKIQSFESALFVEILDENNSLSVFRHLFAQNHHEIAALHYVPHITLGLYHSAFTAEQIFEHIETLEQQQFELDVTHLSFGYYKAKIIQGKLYAEQHIHLGKL